MKRTRVNLLIVIVVILAAAAAVWFFVFNRAYYRGGIVQKPDAYMLDIEKMNCTESHSLELEKGDVLQVHFETVKGSLKMQISDPDGEILYSGDGKADTDFSVTVQKSGTHQIVVKGRRAKGTIHVQLEE